MKKILAIFSCFVLTMGIALADPLPQTYQDFKVRCQKEALSPQGAVKMYFDAIFAYIQADNRDEAIKMLRYIMYARKDWEKGPNFQTFVSRLNDPNMHYIFRSFAKGTSPENGYKMSPENYSLQVIKIVKETDSTRVILKSTGADNPRGVRVKEIDGQWYVVSNASTYAQVRAPKKVSHAHDADYD